MTSPNDFITIGDCFLFKQIEQFGLVLLTVEKNRKTFERTFFPVLLDSKLEGLDKFLNGQIFISSFLDFTTPKGITEGFQVYHFLEESPFDLLREQFNKIGNLKLNKNYQNVTGETMANNIEEFRLQLNMFEEMFGRNARMTHLMEIVES